MDTIQFGCAHCGVRVRVDSKHRGERAKCPRCGIVVTVPEKAEEGAERLACHPSVLANVWRRTAAFLIDWFIVIAMIILFRFLVGYAYFSGNQQSPLAFILIQFVGEVCILWLYWALQQSGPHQATFGKRVLGILVTDGRGRRVSFGRATGRVFAKLALPMALGFVTGWRTGGGQSFVQPWEAIYDVFWIFMGVALYVWPACIGKRQMIHDKVAGTLVFRSNLVGIRSAPKEDNC